MKPVKTTLKQVGQKYRLISELGGVLRQMGPRKLSKDRAELRQALLAGEEPFDYPNDPTSPAASDAAQASVDNYVAEQEGKIATAQGKIDAANADIEAQNAIIAEQQAILDNPESTEEEKAAAQTAITAAEKKITSDEKTITTQTNNIATYESNIENAADKAPAASITEVPETLVLDNTPKKGYKIEADFTANEVTTIEANEKVEGGISIKNTSEEPANLIINVGNSDVTLYANTQWNEVTVESVANDTLTVATSAHIKKLIVKKGRVWVNNALVEDCIDEVVVEGGKVEANPEIAATKVGDLYSKPSVVNINTNLTANKNITTGILTSGHYVYNNNAKVQTNGTGSGASGYMIRGSKLLMDFYGSGEWRSLSNPTIWLSDFDGKVRIYDGKFFNDGNHAECIYAEKGFIEIYGGEFHNTETSEKNFLLNCLDANYKAGTANITVYGGKFYGFDPAHNAAESEEMTTNFVAEGYESIYNEEGGYYEVLPVNTPPEVEPGANEGTSDEDW